MTRSDGTPGHNVKTWTVHAYNQTDNEISQSDLDILNKDADQPDNLAAAEKLADNNKWMFVRNYDDSNDFNNDSTLDVRRFGANSSDGRMKVEIESLGSGDPDAPVGNNMQVLETGLVGETTNYYHDRKVAEYDQKYAERASRLNKDDSNSDGSSDSSSSNDDSDSNDSSYSNDDNDNSSADTNDDQQQDDDN